MKFNVQYDMAQIEEGSKKVFVFQYVHNVNVSNGARKATESEKLDGLINKYGKYGYVLMREKTSNWLHGSKEAEEFYKKHIRWVNDLAQLDWQKGIPDELEISENVEK